MTISLEKRKEAVGIQLQKYNITKVPPVRVGLALDVSGSAQPLYTKGIIQETVNRLQAIALTFDDNGELDMWCFADGTRFSRLKTATAADYDNYVDREILKNRSLSLWGGTDYAPVLTDMIEFWFPGTTKQQSKGLFGGMFAKRSVSEVKATGLPAMGLLVTDGQNYDKSEAEKVLQQAGNTNVYWQMIGVGNPREFKFIEEQADKLPNVGFVNLNSLQVTDQELYAALIADEFANWIKARTP